MEFFWVGGIRLTMAFDGGTAQKNQRKMRDRAKFCDKKKWEISWCNLFWRGVMRLNLVSWGVT